MPRSELYRMVAMPSLCDSTDFGLTSVANNKRMLLKLERDNPVVVDTLPSGGVLQRTGTDRGYYFVADPEERQLVYLMQYKKMDKRLLGVPAGVQTAVWRDLGSDLADSVVMRVYFKYLLPKYGAVMSDRIQTIEGQRMWLGIIKRALGSKLLKVYLVDFNTQQVLHIESKMELQLWLSDVDSVWAWNSMKHQGVRFLVSTKSIPSSNKMLRRLVELMVDRKK